MSADASAYETLGLVPGADALAIEQAYKRLIKQYHPDRQGGDTRRAADINRAYRELRLSGQVKAALDLEQWDEPRTSWARVRQAVLLLGLAGAVTVAATPLLMGWTPRSLSPPLALARERPEQQTGDPMRLPILGDAVTRGIEDAERLSRSSDEVGLAEASRECHRKLRAVPAIALLDHCAAFDDAVVQLQDRDPLRNRGPFSELAVTGRQMSGATLLSDDYLAIDSRLDQIRLRVELALAPQMPEQAGD